MFGKDYIFNGDKIPYNTTDGYTEKWRADINPLNVTTTTSEINRQDYHGIIAYPTFARGRVVTVDGEFYGTKLERGLARNKLSKIFQLQGIPDTETMFKKLEFTDDDDTEWFLKCKVLTLPQYQHEEGAVATFSLSLLAKDPLFYSKTLESVTGNYGLLGGIQLPVNLPTQLNGGINIIEISNDGNFATPLTLTVSGTIKNPRIIHLNSGRYWGITKDLTTEWVSDTATSTSTIDGINAMQYRTDGSELLYAMAGINYYILTGEDFDFNNQDKATLRIDFRDAKL